MKGLQPSLKDHIFSSLLKDAVDQRKEKCLEDLDLKQLELTLQEIIALERESFANIKQIRL